MRSNATQSRAVIVARCRRDSPTLPPNSAIPSHKRSFLLIGRRIYAASGFDGSGLAVREQSPPTVEAALGVCASRTDHKTISCDCVLLFSTITGRRQDDSHREGEAGAILHARDSVAIEGPTATLRLKMIGSRRVRPHICGVNVLRRCIPT